MDKEKYNALLNGLIGLDKKKMAEALRLIDHNGNGKIDASELEAYPEVAEKRRQEAWQKERQERESNQKEWERIYSKAKNALQQRDKCLAAALKPYGRIDGSTDIVWTFIREANALQKTNPPANKALEGEFRKCQIQYGKEFSGVISTEERERLDRIENYKPSPAYFDRSRALYSSLLSASSSGKIGWNDKLPLTGQDFAGAIALAHRYGVEAMAQMPLYIPDTVVKSQITDQLREANSTLRAKVGNITIDESYPQQLLDLAAARRAATVPKR